MAQVHMIRSGMPVSNHGDEGRVSPASLNEDAVVMGAGQNPDDDDDMHAKCDSHRVRDLIHRYEHSAQQKREASQERKDLNENIEVEEEISSSTVATEETLPSHIIEVKEVTKNIGHIVVTKVKRGAQELKQGAQELKQGVQELKKGAQELINGFQILIERFLLPQSCMEPHLSNNIHVPHPDKLIGGMVGLGMNIQKGAKGHLIHSVIPDGLADKSKLQENDVIVSVNGCDITSWEFEELQHFFGTLEEEDFKIVVEREEEDESGNLVCRYVTASIKLSLEGDTVMVDLDIKVHFRKWQWNGESEHHYIFQNNRGKSTQYLTLKNRCFCMSTGNDLTSSRFKFYYYRPVDNGPRAVINVNNNSPLDHGESSRIGEYTDELREGLFVLRDDRIFFTMVQPNTDRFTFQLASRKGYFLTTDAKGNLTTTYFGNLGAVNASGQFDIVPTSEVDKMTPSGRQNFNPKLQGNLNGKLNASNLWK